ncbi:MAG TPA: methyltransferase domain-containing protein [Myxococcota bacterium]
MFRLDPPARTNVVDIYETHAASWWNFDNPIFAPLHAMVPARGRYLDRRRIDLRDKVVVDVGAGGGYVADLCAKRGATVLALDIARGALLAGKGTVGSAAIAWSTASALALPVASNSVDVVVATDVLVHVPLELGGARAAIAEVGRVLKPGGVFWFSTVSDTWLARFVLITLGEDLLRFVHKGTHEPSTFLSPRKMRDHCGAAGLDVVAAEGVGPVGIGRDAQGRLALKMGRLPGTAVMWQGHAIKR